MDTAQRKLAFQVQFWGLIGPLVALVTLLVILIKSPPQAIYLSLATIFGLLTSWKWQTKGVLVALGSILLLYLYQFSEISPNEHLWHIGMNMAIIMGFVITALSFQEIDQLLHVPFSEVAAGEISKEIAQLKKYVQEKDLQITSYEGLVENVKTESVKANQQHEKLLAELMTKQQNLSNVEELLHKSNEQIKQLTEKTIGLTQIEESLLLKQKEIANLKKELQIHLEKPQAADLSYDSEAIEELKSTNDLLSRERGRLESLLFRNQIELHQKTQDLANFQKLEQEIEDYKQNRELIEQALKEAEYKEAELENKIYEKAKIIDGFALKQQESEKSLREEIEAKNDQLKEFSNLESQLAVIAKEKEVQEQAFKQKEIALLAEIEEKGSKLKSFAEIEAQLLKIVENRDAFIAQSREEEKTLQAEIEAKNEKLKEINELEIKLVASIQNKESLLLQFEELKVSHANLNLAFEEIKTSQKEIHERIQDPVKESINEPSSDLVFEFKKIQGKYNQLREQFEAKSQVLNETRKELFKKEESLSKAKLELEEMQNYDFSKQEASVQEYILNLIEESRLKNQELQQEIDELHTIIARLM